MVTPLFVAAADLHFDEQGPWKHRGIVGDAAFGLSQVVDYCLDHGPDFLILLGDLVNRPLPRQPAVKCLIDQLNRVRSGTIPVRYVLGDHDGRQDWPALHIWPVRVDGRCFPVGPFTGYGLDFLTRGHLQSALAGIPAEAQILFTHQKWEEFVKKSGHARLTEVPAQIRYVITGDYHDSVWADLDGGQQVWSPGSIIATSVADDRPRRFLVGYERGGKLACEFVALRSRPIHRLGAGTADDIARIVEQKIDTIVADCHALELPPEIDKPIVDVEYFTDIPHAYARLMAAADRCFLFLRPRDRARQRRAAAAPSRIVPAAREAVSLLAGPDTPGHDWTLRLLDAADLKTEWAAIVAEQTEACHAATAEGA
jgi:DNA repair exonuclease SbcCD nuclease subunit